MTDADGKCGCENAAGKMQIAKKGKRNKTRNADSKNKKRKKSFFQVAVIWLGPSYTVHVVNSWHRLLIQGFFFLSIL